MERAMPIPAVVSWRILRILRIPYQMAHMTILMKVHPMVGTPCPLHDINVLP